MNHSKNEATKEQATGTTKDTERDAEYLRGRSKEIMELTARAREQLSFVARNMHEAFDGALSDVEANILDVIEKVIKVGVLKVPVDEAVLPAVSRASEVPS